MCEIDWELIHKYLNTLIWPILLISAFIYFKEQIIKIINRVTNESEEIEIIGLFKTRFKQAGNLRKEIKAGKQPSKKELAKFISETTHQQIEAIRYISEKYPHSNYDRRRIIENQIRDFSIGLFPEDIYDLFDSENLGHKIGAAISLQEILPEHSQDPLNEQKIIDFIEDSLDDSSSFLRYQVLQLVFQFKSLKEKFSEKLNLMVHQDNNGAVRSLLKLHLNN